MLSAIQIRLGDDSALPGVTDLIASVKADDGSGEPGALVANLANPASLTNDALNTFTAPVGTVLAPNTTYWVVVNEERSDTDRVNLRATAQDEEDEAFPGWSIGNNHLSKVSASGSWNHGATVSNLIVVSGSVIVGTADTTGPVVEQVICFDSSCNLLFDEPQSSNVDHSPPTSAFAITADGAAITVGSALPGGGNRVLLSPLAPQIYQGQTVIVTYTDPTAGNDETAIQDEAGNDASSFTTGADGVPAVTNDSTVAPVAPVTVVPADWSLIPSGLGPGDHFRLIFLSSATRTAEATDIATYNTWVQGLAANGHTDIQNHSSTFRVVGSTAAVDARDNTSTTGTGVAIHWLNGDKAADDYEDFYDETWDEEASMRDESGLP